MTSRQFLIGLTLVMAARVDAGESCSAQSHGAMPPVIELYTSEGCSSCPPADRWLSKLTGDSSIVAMAFHVDYWDRLGWRDRFARPLYTRRQAQEQVRRGAEYSYTPQVVLDGKDHKTWRFGRSPSSTRDRPTATVAIAISRDGEYYVATVTPLANAPTRLTAFWTITENGHTTDVRAGENQGETLAHDYVVREYVEVAAWNASAAKQLQFAPGVEADAQHPRTINLVVIDAKTGEPVQATKIAC
jgi:hypothetical protein